MKGKKCQLKIPLTVVLLNLFHFDTINVREKKFTRHGVRVASLQSISMNQNTSMSCLIHVWNGLHQIVAYDKNH